MFDIINIREIKWKDGDSMMREFEPEFKKNQLKTLAQLLRVISRDVDTHLLKEITTLSQAENKVQYSEKKWGVWSDQSNDWEKSLPIHIREETGFQLGEIATIFNGDNLPYVFYRPKDDRLFIIDYYKKTTSPVELSLDEMKAILQWWKSKIKELT